MTPWWVNGGGESAVEEEEDRGGFCIVRASRRQPILCVPPCNMWTDCPPTFPSVLAAGAQVSRTNTGVHKWWNLFSSQHLGHLQPSMPPQGFQHPPLAPGPPGFSPGSEVSAAQTGQISFWRPSSSELLTSQSHSRAPLPPQGSSLLVPRGSVTWMNIARSTQLQGWDPLRLPAVSLL